MYLNYRGLSIPLNDFSVNNIKEKIEEVNNYFYLKAKYENINREFKSRFDEALDKLFNPSENRDISIVFTKDDEEFYEFCKYYKNNYIKELNVKNSYIKAQNMFSKNPKPLLQTFIDCDHIKIEELGTLSLKYEFTKQQD